MIYLKNEILSVGFSPMGAEIISIIKDEREYLWQGTRSIWSGQAPMLFPITGRLIGDSYTYQGKQFFLERHGFARKSIFTIVENTDNSITMLMSSGEETKRVYPFDFSMYVYYSISGNTLTSRCVVKNTGTDDMLFSIGAHPGFNAEIGNKIRLSDNETLNKYVTDDNGIIISEVPFLNGKREITLTSDVFDKDALILPSPQSTSAEIVGNDGIPFMKMEFGKVPYLLFWAKPSAPYVCIEPWHGICDFNYCTGELEKKPGMITLSPQAEFEQKYTVTIY